MKDLDDAAREQASHDGDAGLAMLRKERRRYRRALQHALRQLESVSEMLAEAAVELALAGAWRARAEARSVGATVRMHDETLAQAGDHLVAALMDLKGRVCAARDVLHHGAQAGRTRA